MRVLMTADTVGGVWTYARELTAGLLARGHAVTLVTLGRVPSEHQREQLAALEGKFSKRFRSVETSYRLEWMHSCDQDLLKSQEFLLELIETERPDVLHLNQFFYGAMPSSVPKVVVAHSDVLSWWRAVKGMDAPESEWPRRYRQWVADGANGADTVVFPSEWMRREFESIYGEHHHACVIWNGIDIGTLPSGERRLRAFSAGRVWDEAKNLSLLDSVRSSVPLFVAGECNSPESGRNHCAQRSPVTYLGPLSAAEVKRWMQTSAIFISPSRYEPFGLAALEAAQSGCALVLSDLETHRELWQDAAFYFQQGNAASLSELLAQLAASPELLRQMGACAHRQAAECFSAETMTDHYCGLYSSLVRQEIAA